MPETLHPTPSAITEQTCWLPPRRRSAGAARQLLRTFLSRHDGGERHVEVGELLLSELVTNAVEHAHVPPDRLIMVHFALADGRLRIEVHDPGDHHLDTGAAVDPPAPDEESGRGLWLVRQLSEQWGCRARRSGIGKAVWCSIAATPDTTATRRSAA
ncbi:ATP-binding protein [Kitasatospora sp. NBC_00240]|uniref:ATP-binding protein n=1 Tax=Kitasatospora sp. NBC_00240 TaxID=2903567 RepID=UPI00225371AC|nr:ATP-binding protein [Kitasatospora sp. NBC_00240]MCX5210714.1 ATP-binding protein [Kitasatospora sp. NBC_00240]